VSASVKMRRWSLCARPSRDFTRDPPGRRLSATQSSVLQCPFAGIGSCRVCRPDVAVRPWPLPRCRFLLRHFVFGSVRSIVVGVWASRRF
jgi:hypothetical protein